VEARVVVREQAFWNNMLTLKYHENKFQLIGNDNQCILAEYTDSGYEFVEIVLCKDCNLNCIARISRDINSISFIDYPINIRSTCRCDKNVGQLNNHNIFSSDDEKKIDEYLKINSSDDYFLEKGLIKFHHKIPNL
jgi:hypothetical protein